MRTLHTLILSTVAAAALTACGGGSDASAPAAAAAAATTPTAGAAVTLASVADTPFPGAAPTATLTATQASADALKAEVAAAFTASQKTAASASLSKRVGFLSASADTNGLERTQEVVDGECALGGTLDSELPIANLSKPAIGTTYNFTFNKCKNGTSTDSIEVNGKWTVNFSRYASESDAAFVAIFNGLTLATKTDTVTVNGGYKCDLTAKLQSCALSDGTRGWDTSLTYTNGVLNGTYATKYGDGTVTVKYVNYSDTSGTATITGKAPTKTVITRTTVGGAVGLKIEITDATGKVTMF